MSSVMMFDEVYAWLTELFLNGCVVTVLAMACIGVVVAVADDDRLRFIGGLLLLRRRVLVLVDVVLDGGRLVLMALLTSRFCCLLVAYYSPAARAYVTRSTSRCGSTVFVCAGVVACAALGTFRLCGFLAGGGAASHGCADTMGAMSMSTE